MTPLERKKRKDDFIKDLLQSVSRDCMDLLVELFVDLLVYADENKNELDIIVVDFLAKHLKSALVDPLSRGLKEA